MLIRNYRQQSGFTIVEILLVIIAVTLLAGVGLYGYNSIKNNKEDEKEKSSTKNSQTAKTPKTPKKEYFKFDDLGIKFLKTSNNKDFVFKSDPSVPNTYYVEAPGFTAALVKCFPSDTTASGSFGAFGRSDGTYNPDEAMGEGLVKQFDTFYISMSYPNGIGSCEDESYQTQFGEIFHSYKNILSTSLESVDVL